MDLKQWLTGVSGMNGTQLLVVLIGLIGSFVLGYKFGAWRIKIIIDERDDQRTKLAECRAELDAHRQLGKIVTKDGKPENSDPAEDVPGGFGV